MKLPPGFKFILFAMLVVFTQCKAKKHVAHDAVREVVEEQEELSLETESASPGQKAKEEVQFEEAGSALIMAIQGNTEIIKKYLPTVDVARYASPEEAGDMDDEAIKSNLLEPLTNRFYENVKNLAQDAQGKQVDLMSLQFVGYDLLMPADMTATMYVTTILLEGGKMYADIPISCALKDGELYMFEILLSTDVFKPKE